MATSGREGLYKHRGKDISEMKFATKATVKLNQNRHRDRQILTKRFKVETLEEAELILSAEEEIKKVKNAVELLKHGKKVDALITLRRCFARSPNNSEVFMKSEGLQALQSCLLSSDTEVLHAAAWCAINLTAGVSFTARQMKHFSPLLIRFLQGSDPVMQELCAWAIGNLAAESDGNREILLQQGSICSLIDLISSEQHLLLEARSQSVLFALINLARDEKYSCIRCMQDSSIFNHLTMMLKTTDVTCDVNFEIGWLTNNIYGREETYLEQGHQYGQILGCVISRLSQMLKLEDSPNKKVIVPFLYSLGNIVGLSPNLALAASSSLNFLTVLYSCLTSNMEFIRSEALWVMINFMAEPSCRVMIMCQPRFLNMIFHLCQSADEETALNALYLVEATLKVSCWMSQYLVEHGTMSVITKLLASPRRLIVEAALNIVMNLVTGTTKGVTALLDADALSQLQSLVLNERHSSIKEKAADLIDSL